MQDHSQNIYRIPRVKANLTQERAAELIPVSVESIRAYETSQTVPPDEVVCRMTVVYDAPQLAYQHLMSRSEAARQCLPVVEVKNLTHAIVCLKKELNDVVGRLDDLFEIGSDGRVTADEQAKFEVILKELSELAGAAMAVKYAKAE